MNTSEQINEIATALSAAQAELINPEKTKTANVKSEKGSFSYSYADLADTLDVVRKVLAKHQLSIVQATQMDGDSMSLITRIMHGSGQWIEGVYPVCRMGAHQQMGSALTYARRYSLFAMVGIAGEEDTDGQGAAEAGGVRRQPNGAAKPALEPQTMTPAALEAQMIRTLEGLGSVERVNNYSALHRPAYDSLPPDAQKRVKAAKEKRLAELSGAPATHDNVLAAG